MNEEINQIVSQIMSNPEFGNLVNELKQSGVGQNGELPSAEVLMRQLPAVMEMLGKNGQSHAETGTNGRLSADRESAGTSGENGRGETEQGEKGSPAPLQEQILPAEQAVQLDKVMRAVKRMDSQKCEKLLAALKPYLRRERGEVIDKAMSVMKITDILGAMQSIDSGDAKR